MNLLLVRMHIIIISTRAFNGCSLIFYWVMRFFFCLPVLATSNHYILLIKGSDFKISITYQLSSYLKSILWFKHSNIELHYTTFEFLAHARNFMDKRDPDPPPSLWKFQYY